MRIAITGGGTGGHIYPALSFVKYVREQLADVQFLYFGTNHGLEAQLVPKAHLKLETIDIRGLKRKITWANITTAVKFCQAVHQVKQKLREFQPDVVIGMGGYVCAPVVFAATRLKIPTIIHEQNSVPGLTNKFLAQFVDKIAISMNISSQYFPLKKIVLTGNPRAQEVAQITKNDQLSSLGLDPQKKTVLIFGGSQGALKINQTIVKILPKLAEKDYQLLYASGEMYYEQFLADFKKAEKMLNVKIVPYLFQMTSILADVDLVVARSGATSIAEFTALGLPAILIPSPNVTNDHQTKNAQELVACGGAKIIPDDQLAADNLLKTIDHFFADQKEQELMHQASLANGHPDASEKLFNLAMNLISKSRIN